MAFIPLALQGGPREWEKAAVAIDEGKINALALRILLSRKEHERSKGQGRFFCFCNPFSRDRVRLSRVNET